MNYFKKMLLSAVLIFTAVTSYAGDYDMPDVATLKARIAELHPDFAEHLKYVYNIAGKKKSPIELVAGLGLDIHDYEKSQEGFGVTYNVDAVYFLRDVFVRKICAEHPSALKELEELQMDHGKPALTKAVMITMPTKAVLQERLGGLAGLLKIDNVMNLAEKEIEVMEFAAALFRDFYALAKKSKGNVYTQRSALAVFLLRDKLLEDLLQGDAEAIAKMKECGAFKDDS